MNLHNIIIIYHVVDKKTGKVMMSTRDEKDANIVVKSKRHLRVKMETQQL